MPGQDRSVRPRRRGPGALAAVVLAGLLGLAACSGGSSPGGAGGSSGSAQGGNANGGGGDGNGGGGSGGQGGGITQAAVTPPGKVTISAVGDTMLGSTGALPPDPATFFDEVKPELRHGIVFGNLEGTLTTASGSKCGAGGNGGSCFAFRDPPAWARYYKAGGFTVLNEANNHSFDFGPAGQAQTVRAIKAAGLVQTGLPHEITVVRRNGIRVAFVAFAPYPWAASLLHLGPARALIRRAASKADVVVVYMHAGAEGSDADHVSGHEEIFLGEDRGNAKGFAEMAIDNGASLVIASGPHVLRGLQFYQRHLIAYSLGNFAGYGNFATEGDLNLSAILRVRLTGSGRFVRGQLFPVEFAGQGQPVPGGGTIAFMNQLSAADFGPHAARITPTGHIKLP
jgi:Bacterial capsule synthesis protein PGA_cap